MDNCVKCGSPMQRPSPDELKTVAANLEKAVGAGDNFAWAGATGYALSKLWMLEWYFRGVCVICAPLSPTQGEAVA